MIYHIVLESDFRAQLESVAYRPSGLADDDFVHCALEPSVIPVANDYYADGARACPEFLRRVHAGPVAPARYRAPAAHHQTCSGHPVSRTSTVSEAGKY